MINRFTIHVIAAPMPKCILKFGAMTQIVSDNASLFESELISELGRLLRISRHYTIPYHHEGDGVCERVFATFHRILHICKRE